MEFVVTAPALEDVKAYGSEHLPGLRLLQMFWIGLVARELVRDGMLMVISCVSPLHTEEVEWGFTGLSCDGEELVLRLPLA